MPPRIQPQRLSAPQSCQCFRTRPKMQLEPVTIPATQTRQFHRRGKARNTTALRRDMWEWLAGPGKVFRDPLPGSTNYMSAYDKQGVLLRSKRQRQDRQDRNADAAIEGKVYTEEEEAEIVQKEKEDGLDEVEMQANAAKRAAARQAKADLDARGGVPTERVADMRPYPLNHHFRSESVLSEDLREELYRQVALQGQSISTISAAYGVDLRRVAAVVRLKTVEKQWQEEGKQLAKPYNDAVLAMLPQTPFKPNNPTKQIYEHESVNDLPVHASTRQQLFYPVSESRQFTREDAAKAFHENLLPADKRIPHPELVALEKDHLNNVGRRERWENQLRRDAEIKEARANAEAKKKAWEERTQRVVETRRWNFKFQDISWKGGKDGRGRGAVGARYGMPHEDRKRGQVKIPTSVE
ncbi:37S ribosomal protein S35, mitochondrial [Pseudocercospora fuligena]|uniref:37S ribosomal protein S35, mitochondrial n=1 Tax=Pseudocercospora fuligena TaxID=685502 RepID=A0A8H6RTB1_9PEZI|nr:37S ribosomal protein S35, mitochondrial [Pseudocercospora fuligena]